MIAQLKTVAFDAPDIAAEADFYAALAGWTQSYTDDDWITMRTPDGWRIAFQLAPDHVAPRWPDPAAPQQAHLDLRVPDIDAAADKAVSLGATPLRRGERRHTLADPASHPFDLCVKEDDPNTTVMGVMLDCPDAKALSTFYSELLGKPITYEAPGAAMIGEDGGMPVLFQQVADYRAPRWPDPAAPQQVHFDLLVERADLESAERAALAIGATRLPAEGDNWRVYADPAGKPFCLTWNEASV
ncbi:VOC family protein [Actinoallomurus acaciae]|uniref:VOC family protein n=1 Tax=Actinoallomurus acaciae TaxID=502577 RepID=A0ABV5YRT3_9ACTN